ncbi:hypothetical protein NLJ89_g9846 [Agrocybe chaxingu]|uniref:DUF6533 domain-containing protein n=1 Tax=Agrocybe chaxingu TaxID=84603 RepID=A0A9W8JPZ3_9AGAR|nr:hypothetical protein NLJ89_g9846 [Agrocybe chaxingu]
MAFFPPELASQVMVSIYILVGSLVVLIWDVLNNLKNDWKLVRNYRIGAPTVAYFVSRWSSIGYLLGGAIFATAPLGNCYTSGKIISTLYAISIPSTSLLFFFRVRAMYLSTGTQGTWVIRFFAFMWLAVLGGSIVSTPGVTASNIGTTEYCINSGLKSYVSMSGIIPFANDTLVFLAITWRLMDVGAPIEGFGGRKRGVKNVKVAGKWELRRTVENGLRTGLFGANLSRFTRGLLQDGQVYYMSTVVINVMNLIIYYNESIPIVYRTSLTMPNIMLMNVMACRVFRRTKFGIYRETTVVQNELTLPTISNGASTATDISAAREPIVFRQVETGFTSTGLSSDVEAASEKGVKEDEKS